MTVLNLSVCKYWLLGVGLLVSIGQVSAVQFVKAPEISKIQMIVYHWLQFCHLKRMFQ